jgi:diguanylate cyclase (GGDEF)-like protein
MKAERIGRSGVAARAGVASYVRRGQTLAPSDAAPPVPATAIVLGIPESEFTPRVRDAIMRLLSEVRSLKEELEQAKTRLESAERAADQDHLLPVLNRRAFVRELTRHIAFSARYGAPASLVYFDLDDFKRINDTYGHAAGDAVLNHFAASLSTHVRESDVVGRLGGDEFGVILTHAAQEQANRKAASLLDYLNANPADWNGQILPVGVSYGAFELKPTDNAETAMARADEAMYSAKRAGQLGAGSRE